MTTPDFRKLCEELVEICKHDRTYTQTMELVARADAALATSPPEPPTNEELINLWIQWQDVLSFARVVLERWGNG
jgi:hypothetical protein